MNALTRVALATTLVFLAACGGSSDAGGGVTNPGGGGGGGITPTPPASTNAVTVSDDKFSPNAITVSPGTTVTWTWASDAALHNVTFNDGTASTTQGAGTTFSRTFGTAGTFNYVCTLHAGMTGSVVVK
jgi:plastocyanin